MLTALWQYITFRGRRGNLIKILWHDGLDMSLQVRRLKRGRPIWQLSADGTIVITPVQLRYLLDVIDWRNPQHTWCLRTRLGEAAAF